MRSQRINIASSAAKGDDYEVAVNVRKPAAKSKRRRRNIVAQLGKKSVRINISGKDDNDDEPPSAAADAFKIPIDE